MSRSALSEPRRVSPPIWLVALAAFTIGCGMRLLDPLLPMMARDFGVSLAAVAPLIGGFALAYGLGQLGAGPVGDALGKLRIVAVGIGLYAGTLIGASLVPDFGGLLAARVMSGLVAAAKRPSISLGHDWIMVWPPSGAGSRQGLRRAHHRPAASHHC
jgi:predicted MFS family arabinose efflux permease